MDRLEPVRIGEFRHAIREHYRAQGRAFPWRSTRDAYEILVSEIMLQQTQTDRVVPKYREWLDAFPTPEALAKAPFSAVLERWIGLGYNRRARFLQETCRIIAEEKGGRVPSDPDELDDLPGIGPYTARAVSTFAFGIPHAFIETNIRAVFIFFFFPDRDDVSDAEILDLVDQTLDRENPRDWYYALMDYGASLKKKVVNPNRKSRHYAKQSRFEGSLRQARGAVLRHLSAYGPAGTRDISASSGLSEERVREAARALAGEGLVAEASGIYRVP